MYDRKRYEPISVAEAVVRLGADGEKLREAVAACGLAPIEYDAAGRGRYDVTEMEELVERYQLGRPGATGAA